MTTPFPPQTRLVAYLRDSGGEEQDLSIPQQQNAIQAWCNQHNYILTHTYIDEARPGSSVIGREAFQQMIQHFHDPNCTETGVIIWKHSRFARDIDDAQYYRADLRRRGYTIHSMTDTIPEGINGKLFEAAIDWMNARFLEDLSTDVKRGLYHLIQQHGALGGTPPRGFIRTPINLGTHRDGKPHIVHRWSPDPETWETCLLAWKMRAAGATYRQIHQATHLYNSLNSYNSFFRNRIYLGELHFANQIIPNYVPPLITQEIWDTVQRINNRTKRLSKVDNPHHPRRVNSTYILSGLIYCAQCQSPLNGETISFTNKTSYHYYACTGAQRQNGCTARKIPKTIIENAVIDALINGILTPANLTTIQEEVSEYHTQAQNHANLELNTKTKKLAEIQRQKRNILEILRDTGSKSRSLASELERLEYEETAIQQSIEELKNRHSVTNTTLENLLNQSENIKTQLKDPNKNPHQVNQILRGLIHKITVERDHNTIRGLLQYYDNFMSMSVCPHSALTHTHKITLTLNRPYRLKADSPANRHS